MATKSKAFRSRSTDQICQGDVYFTVPMTYLIAHKKDRILHLDDLFAEQVTLKFSTYLARVAIP